MIEHTNKPTLFLLPTSIGETSQPAITQASVNQLELSGVKTAVVETEKVARAHIQALGLQTPIQDFSMIRLDKHTSYDQVRSIADEIAKGESMVQLSDAGFPAVADPGSKLVRECHRANVRVTVLSLQSSIMNALMMSGLNGQSFAFHGYIPRQADRRVKFLKRLENISEKSRQAQIFMEAPYRNAHVWKSLMSELQPTTELSVSVDIAKDDEYSFTAMVQNWQKLSWPDLEKRPAIFIIDRSFV